MDGSVLIVEDDTDTRDLLLDALGKRGFTAEGVASGDLALARLKHLDVCAVVTDLQLGGMTGLELCARVIENRPDLPVIVVTAHGDMEVAIAAIRAGAYDFITKPVSLDALAVAVGRAVKYQQLTSEVRRLRQQVTSARRVESILGDSPAMRGVCDLVEHVAPSDVSVLITGESGTGKELVARAVHSCSKRKDAPFVAINCAAMPASLLESELFGHVRGAFTDAKRARGGLFVQAHGGTLFLDEIGEMPLEMQTKLLRVLAERTVRPVGGDEEVSFDARLVTATNRDIDTEVEEGRFRADLYYRINVVHIPVPPLRERQGDVLLLAHHFLKRQAERNGKSVTSIAHPAARKLCDYDWPGNVRELENCMERAVALTRMSEISVDDLPTKIRDHEGTHMIITSDNPEEMPTLDEMEGRYVRRVLAAVGGNKTQAARVLGLDRRSLYRRLEKPAAGGGSTPTPEQS